MSQDQHLRTATSSSDFERTVASEARPSSDFERAVASEARPSSNFERTVALEARPSSGFDVQWRRRHETSSFLGVTNGADSRFHPFARFALNGFFGPEHFFCHLSTRGVISGATRLMYVGASSLAKATARSSLCLCIWSVSPKSSPSDCCLVSQYQ